MLYGDIQKAFLQILVREAERNTLRFQWIESLKSKKIKVLIFTRLVFGLTKSPFISERTMKSHFEIYRHEFEEIVNRNVKDMYVDDLSTGEII